MRFSSKKAAQIIGNTLRFGLMSAIGTILLGFILFVIQDGTFKADYHTFAGQPQALTQLDKIFMNAAQAKGLYLIQLGIMLIIATPILRVIACLITFSLEQNRLYAFLSTVVLIILLCSFL